MGGKKFNIFFLLSIFYSFKLCSSTFFSTDLDFCNQFYDISPVGKNNHIDHITFGISNRFLLNDLTTFYSISKYNYKDFSFGHIVANDLNTIFKKYTFGAKVVYNIYDVNIGVLPFFVFTHYVDDEKRFDGGLILSSQIFEKNFHLMTSFILKKSNNSSLLILGYMKNSFDMSLQVVFENKLIVNGKIEYRLNKDFIIDFSLDSEGRIFCGIELVRHPFFVDYSTFLHPNLPVSNDVRISYYRENRNVKLKKIKVVPVEFDIRLKKKKLKDFYVEGKIDLNNAFYEEILSMEGFSKTILRRIYIYRLLNGKIKSYEEIESLPGIGKKSIEKLKMKTFLGE